MGNNSSQCVFCTKQLGLDVFKGTTSRFGFEIRNLIIRITNWKEKNHKNVLVKRKTKQTEIDILELLSDTSYCIHILGYNNNYFVTELCPQGDLYYYIDTHKEIPTETLYHIIRQLILAIQECHSRNVVHVDIKLENIGICNNHNIKLIDFGSAIYKPSYTDDEILKGSKYYLPPECVLHNQHKQTIHANELNYIDFWEAGVVIFILLNHRFPFTGKKTTYTWNKGVDPTLKSLTDSLLQRDPLKRLDLDTFNVECLQIKN